MKRIGKYVRFFAIIFAAVLTAGAGGGLYAADFSTAARLGFELDQANNLKAVPGIDLRVVGGRGLIGSKLSADYLPGNFRGYNNGTAGDIILVSSFGLLQASIFYGDLTFYTGPGTSLYVMPGTAGAFTTSATDSLMHYLMGAAYLLYPLQVFAEIEFDIEFSPVKMGSSRVKIGVGLMQ
jgi:hypothetical protein